MAQPRSGSRSTTNPSLPMAPGKYNGFSRLTTPRSTTSPLPGAHEIQGDIPAKGQELGGADNFGYPTTDEATTDNREIFGDPAAAGRRAPDASGPIEPGSADHAALSATGDRDAGRRPHAAPVQLAGT
ncbi:hypothetical protein AB0F91_34955 [Amycolatopsis sp. NPDC023774]|uniref:hypothetical protein n=1 Tax=Amycolatopsis sp. NPDC023774 TaxID=3155015 RepID=UPI0033FFBD63